MKKYLLYVLSLLLIVPFEVKAESKYLYDVLKDEAEKEGGLAREYTGEHHDSFTEEPTHKIYHWYATTNSEGDTIRENSNVIFGGFCWQIVRTTDTGGVKLLYNGESVDGKCKTWLTSSIGKTMFNSTTLYSPALIGYMYNPNTMISYKATGKPNTGSLYGNNVTYSNGIYTLIDTTTTKDSTHNYSCANTTGKCSVVRYYYYNDNYVELNNGMNIEQSLNEMLNGNDVNKTNSLVKTFIEDWYENNLINYADDIEDIIFCNDRTIENMFRWNHNSTDTRQNLTFISANSSYVNLNCNNITDKFSISNNKAPLEYPIGLLTASEIRLPNNRYALYRTSTFWLASPYDFWDYYPMTTWSSSGTVNSALVSYNIDVFPSISLKPNTKYVSGDGTKDNPYVVRKLIKSNIVVINDNNISTIELANKTDIEELSNVSFTLLLNDGFYLKKLLIKDSNDNVLDYTNIGNEYSFIMPDSNVTITSIYEKVKNSVNVEAVNETEDLNIEIEDLTQVEYNEEVKFKVIPIKGYKIKSIKVLDVENNEVEFTTTENENEYAFNMPARAVTIVPSYERVSNSVNVEENSSEQIIIEVNDSSAVLYEDKVKIKVQEKDGYKLTGIKIVDLEGNEIEYTSTENDGEYEFIMPASNVVITPIYEIITVPDTEKNKDYTLYYVLGGLALVLGIVYIVLNKKKK